MRQAGIAFGVDVDGLAATQVRVFLEPGEELLWAGRPKRSRLDDRELGGLIAAAWAIPTALLGVAVTRLKEDAPERQITAVAEGILTASIAIGLFALFVGTAVQTLRRWSPGPPVALLYGLTDRRAVVVGEDGERVRSVDLDALDSVRTEVNDRGDGTIYCKSRALSWWLWDFYGTAVEGPLFSKIEQPQLVHETIMRALGSPSGLGPYQIEYAWERRLRDLLSPREHLVWSGRPQQSRSIDRSSLAPSLLALPFFILPAYLVREAVASRDPRREGIGAVSDLQLKAIIAVAVVAMAFGLYVLVLRFFVDAWRRKRTSYGLTGSRAIVREPGLVRSVPLSTVLSVSISDESDERGTIHCRSEAMERQIHLGSTRWTITRSHDGPLFVEVASPQAIHSQFTGLITGAIDPIDRRSSVDAAQDGQVTTQGAE